MLKNTDELCVMYLGEIVEQGPTQDIIKFPRHPYTKALLESRPAQNLNKNYLPTIEGRVPALNARPKGCQFSPRCQIATEKCHHERPELVAVKSKKPIQNANHSTSENLSEEQKARCFYPIEYSDFDKAKEVKFSRFAFKIQRDGNIVYVRLSEC